MQYLRPSPRTVHWGYFDASLAPVLEVDTGEVFRLRCVSGAPDDEVAPAWMPPEIRELYATVRDRGPGGHLLTGPVWVRGARPGDVLEVEIRSVRLAAPYGFNSLAPLHGIFPNAIDRVEREIIPLDLDTGIATLGCGVRLPTHPFFGVLGVAPPSGWGRITSSAPRAHGGNLDNKELVGGTALLLPVWAEGALFSAGDGHAAQGDGEVNITAIETCLEGEFRLGVRDDVRLALPVAVTPTHLITMGFDPSLDNAARAAVAALLELLERYGGISWRQAYRLASVAADLHVTQVVNGEKGVHAMLARTLLAQLPSTLPFLRD
jgi:acetamidase/formamidase